MVLSYQNASAIEICGCISIWQSFHYNGIREFLSSKNPWLGICMTVLPSHQKFHYHGFRVLYASAVKIQSLWSIPIRSFIIMGLGYFMPRQWNSMVMYLYDLPSHQKFHYHGFRVLYASAVKIRGCVSVWHYSHQEFRYHTSAVKIHGHTFLLLLTCHFNHLHFWQYSLHGFQYHL